MPDDGRGCPECAKVILNGGTAGAVLGETCKTIYNFLEQGGTFADADVKDLVIKANHIEDLVFLFQRKVLESIGFKGPWPHALS